MKDQTSDTQSTSSGGSVSGSSGTYAYGTGAQTYNESGRTYYIARTAFRTDGFRDLTGP